RSPSDALPVPPRRSSDLAKEAAVFSVELADALVADLVSCTRGVHPIHKHPLPCPLQPTAFGIEAGSSRSMRETDDEVLKRPSVRDRKSTRLNSSHEWISY